MSFVVIEQRRSRIQCRQCGVDLAFNRSLACSMCGWMPDGLSVIEGTAGSAKSQHKEKQIEFFDAVPSAEWEIERPNGAPRLHQWILEEKFRRATSKLTDQLRGATALVVCGGSGMDAEALARAGALVVTSDLSPAAAERAIERGRRHAFPLVSVVADAEALPFPNESFDVVYTHDGLHHLEDPREGIREMARVSRRVVSITEPADAALTRCAAALGLADCVEEAGNPVRRLRLTDVCFELERAGFAIVDRRRYALFYRHEPRFFARVLSAPAFLRLSMLSLLAANRLGGRFGNKLSVQAVRTGVA